MNRRTDRLLRAWLAAQLAASIVANELGAADNLEARIIAVLAPLILFGSIESMLWIPAGRDLLGTVRTTALIGLGAGSAWLSFGTIGEFGRAGGLDRTEQAILALIIDGGILVATLTLLSSRRRLHDPPVAAPEPVAENTHERDDRTPEPEPLDKPSIKKAPSTTERNLPAHQRRQLVAAAAAAIDVGPVDADQLAARFGVSKRTIQRDLEALTEAAA